MTSLKANFLLDHVIQYLKLYNDSIITGQKKTKSTLEWGPALGFIPEMEVKRYKINIY